MQQIYQNQMIGWIQTFMRHGCENSHEKDVESCLLSRAKTNMISHLTNLVVNFKLRSSPLQYLNSLNKQTTLKKHQSLLPNLTYIFTLRNGICF
jgi:hypothetical protein